MGRLAVRSPYFNGVTITGIALLMVSKVPTVSLKRIVSAPYGFPTLLAFVVATAFLTTAPWPTLMSSGGLSELDPADDRSYHRLRAPPKPAGRDGENPSHPVPVPPRCRSTKRTHPRPNGGTEKLSSFAGFRERMSGHSSIVVRKSRRCGRGRPDASWSSALAEGS